MRNIHHQEIHFSPFATNVIDCLNRTDLQTPYGKSVSIKMVGMDFVIKIGEEKYFAHTNSEASYILNTYEVGIKRKEA